MPEMQPEIQPEVQPEVSKKIDIKKEIFEWGKALAVAAVLAFIIHTFLFMMIEVQGSSMIETLHTGDRIASTIIDMKINGPQRGEILILRYPGGKDRVIKRVIAVPGDTIAIANGLTILNGEALDEPYVKYPRVRDNMATITLDEDEYFVMGDNRSNSNDSRAVGPVKRDMFIAKAQFRVWPIDSIGGIE